MAAPGAGGLPPPPPLPPGYALALVPLTGANGERVGASSPTRALIDELGKLADKQLAARSQSSKQRAAAKQRGEVQSSESSDDEDYPPDPHQCTATGPGFAGGASGTRVKLILQLKDSRGKRIKEGGEDVVVRVSMVGAGLLSVDVTDNEDGTYTATYIPPNKGNYQVTVEVNGIPIAGSPFPVFFSAPVDPATLAAEQAAEAAAAAPPLDGAAAAQQQQQPGGGGDAGNGSIASMAAAAGMSALASLSPDEHLRTLYLGNISTAVPSGPERLRQLFGVFGTVVDLRLMGERQDMAVLTFTSPDAQRDAQQLNMTMFGDRPLFVTAPMTAMQAGVAPANPHLAMQMQQILQMQATLMQSQRLAAQVAQMRAMNKAGNAAAAAASGGASAKDGAAGMPKVDPKKAAHDALAQLAAKIKGTPLPVPSPPPDVAPADGAGAAADNQRAARRSRSRSRERAGPRRRSRSRSRERRAGGRRSRSREREREREREQRERQREKERERERRRERERQWEREQEERERAREERRERERRELKDRRPAARRRSRSRSLERGGRRGSLREPLEVEARAPGSRVPGRSGREGERGDCGRTHGEVQLIRDRKEAGGADDRRNEDDSANKERQRGGGRDGRPRSKRVHDGASEGDDREGPPEDERPVGTRGVERARGKSGAGNSKPLEGDDGSPLRSPAAADDLNRARRKANAERHRGRSTSRSRSPPQRGSKRSKDDKEGSPAVADEEPGGGIGDGPPKVVPQRSGRGRLASPAHDGSSSDRSPTPPPRPVRSGRPAPTTADPTA